MTWVRRMILTKKRMKFEMAARQVGLILQMMSNSLSIDRTEGSDFSLGLR